MGTKKIELTGKNSLDFTSILIPEEMLLVAMVTE